MSIRLFILLNLSCLVFSSPAHTQNVSPWRNLFQPERTIQNDTSRVALQLTSHLTPEIITSNIVFFYQEFISSQDMPVCVFEPSCSRYGQQALRKYGFFTGILHASDRLQRCNGLGYKHNDINEKTGKFIDPP